MSTPLRCTYRLQLGPGLGFGEARALVPYLRDLGVSHLYLSPAFQAREGSTHGYDVVDPTRISAELGGEDAYQALAQAAREHGLGIVQDIVPNHMAADPANPSWADEERRRRVFDIEENPPHPPRHRRFFDIDHLAGVRQEDPEVFEETHRLALALVRDGLVDGLRVDHPDGLADPAGYLRRLRDAGAGHVWIEKILDTGEKLRDWPVDGTVGYEALNDLQAVYVDPAGEGPLTDLYAELTGERRSFAHVAAEAKLEQAATTFAADVERLRRVCPLPSLERALASLPIYRTYVEPWSGRVEAPDREALAEARLPQALRRALLLEDDVPAEFVTRFQQTSPPIMAKGVEDTAFYRWNRLVALNEVGGDPARFGLSVDALHAANAERSERFPHNLLITQTHDTKRSGDARARIGALAGLAEEWGREVRAWFSATAELVERGAPDDNERYLLFQTLVGVGAVAPERLDGYLEKALREEKTNTNWVQQNGDWEQRVQRFGRAVLDHPPFRERFDPFVARVAEAGHRAALGQLLLKLTAPGVPDLYQGDELVSLSLVDPDNRRPVDWQRRRRLLDDVREGRAERSHDFEKLALIVAALDLRARRPEAFAGGYEPLDAGRDACAYLRGDDVLALAIPREAGERAVVRCPGRWRDVLTAREHDLSRGVAAGELAAGRGHALLERR